MPELISLYEAYADQRDKFEILAIHDKSLHSFAELDKHLPRLRDTYWQGKDLPFPVLLDASGKTEELYGITTHPTGLLIDPTGRVVGEAAPADLEAKLARLPVATQWARHRDMQKNVLWSFEPSAHTLTKLAEILHTWTRCPIELDAAAIEASGLTANGPLPGVVIGTPISLRSLEALLLAPHGLGVAASTDGKKLLITRAAAATSAGSDLQKRRARALTEQLDHGLPAEAGSNTKPLAIKDQTLLDAVKQICNEYDLPIGLDAKAMGAGTLDPQATVNGRIEPTRLRQSLMQLLDPLGLRIEVRDEVVFVTRKD